MQNEEPLFRGLPVVKNKDGKFLIYSPYKRKIVETSNLSNLNEKIISDLKGEPKVKRNEENADLGLIVSKDCNLRCIYCFAFGGEKKIKMPNNIIEAAIDHVITKKTKRLRIEITGGEPTTNPEAIYKVVEYSKKKGLPTILIIGTNGIMNDKLFKFLIKNKFIFHISFDGLPQIHDSMRPLPTGEGSSKYVIETIKKLVKVKADFKVRSTITNYSAPFMPKMINFLADLGVKYVCFEPINLWGRARRMDIAPCDINIFLKYFYEATSEAEKRGIILTHDVFDNFCSPSTNSCPVVSGQKMVVLPDGNVTRCYDVMEEDHPLASLFIVGKFDSKENKFVFNKEKVNRLDNYNVETIEKCKNCFSKYICSGGCLLRHLTEFSKDMDIQKRNENECNLTKGIIKEAIIKTWENEKRKHNSAEKNSL